ncbi:MAG TPA: cell envelope biogenesis protein OmpA, partial [Hyalangium sp.]|nr:cell envelope biogenesis protein OmpA [Hyalangium sp.]
MFVSSTKGFSAGDLVMVLQTTGIVPEPARGDPGPIHLSNDPVGRWELARVTSASGQELMLAAPLLHSYAGLVTQIIRVPEYTDVTVKSGASLVAAPWDGSRGGVLAFLVSGTIHNEGELQASGAGFRGGLTGQESHDFIACANLPAAIRPGAGRGEGISFLDFGVLATGLENASNGGGGGICPASGGGGGGNGAAGGRGGDALTYGDGIRDIGGRGGAGLVYSMLDHLTLGGGGGRGYGMGSHAQAGTGGGAIFVRGQRLTGSGSILANGTAGENAIWGGAGGGGAGGSISVRVADSAACALISARGGDGGSSSAGSLEAAGPGGGGGGGRVLYQADQTSSCPIAVEAGLAGDLIAVTPGLGTGAQPTASQTSAYRGTITRLSGDFERMANCNSSLPAFTKPSPTYPVVKVRPTVQGYLAPNDTAATGVKVGFEGTNGMEVTANYDPSSKTWTATATADLSAGQSYTIRATSYCGGGGNGERGPENAIVVTVDGTAPQTVFVSTPSDPHDQESATFSFRAGDETQPVSFQCTLNGQAEFSCGTAVGIGVVSWPLTALTNGSHTFTVAAVDVAENRDPTPLEFQWVVDAKPRVVITDFPPNSTRIRDATFEFQSPNDASSTFMCKLGGDPEWTVCTSPKTYPNLDDGGYTFQVKALTETREGDAASHPWVVDTEAPDTEIGQKPSNPSNSASATFSFSSTEGGSSFECSLDSAAYVACTSPKTYPGLSNTGHTFSVKAKDAAGNEDPVPASYPWVVDTEAPDTEIGQKPSNPSNSASATFSFSSTEGGSSFECSLDSAAYV